MTKFCHLHLHTEYSLLDGACRIKDLLKLVKSMGMEHCAITDHGVMYGVVDFYKEAKAQGVHPVIGCEVYICENRFEKEVRESSHLILLCENQKGYENLIKLVSEGFLTGYYYRPRIDFNLLKKHSEGLICSSACLSGDIPRALLDGNTEKAEEYAKRYLDIFGEGNFYIELMDHLISDEKRVLPGLIKLANRLNIPMIATNDAHYLRKEDARAQDVLMCIQTGKTLTDETRMRMDTQELYVKSPEEMAAIFPNLPEALENTVKIAERCHVDFDFNTTHLPSFSAPEGSVHMLRRLCEEGLKQRYGDIEQKHIDRLEYELKTITDMGYADYFLIVWDFIKYAKDKGIPVGPGRGSGAGSIVAYSLRITDIDPLKYNLLFERFLNPERITMPDLDIDFCYNRRQEVIDYVARKYGQDHVSQIITFGTMSARAVVRDVGRVLGMSYQDVDVVAKKIPFMPGITLDKALKTADLLKAYEDDYRVKDLIDTAKSLEGMPRHASTHAAGVLITAKPVTDYVPLQLNDEVVTTQFPMGTLEALGLLKMDFLGLRTLTVIQDTLDMVLENHGIEIKPEDIPLGDKAVYDMISQGDTDGIFQLESGGMRAFLKELQPHDFEDIIAAVSLYRPGPMDSIPKFIQGKKDLSSVRYTHEKLRPILDVTYGCMVYQEQVMQIVRDLAGYSYGRSDLMRRAMSKKKADVMAQERQYFVHGMVENGDVVVPGAIRLGVPEKAAEAIFDEMSSFAAYAFNKSHAAAYALLALQTGWLKAHYTTEFMAAMMNSYLGANDRTAVYIAYCRANGIQVLPPSINRSYSAFTVDEGCIRFGLSAVKNVGQGAVAHIIEKRKEKPFADIFDFCDRAAGDKVNKRAVESLIKAGAFDHMGANRYQLELVYEAALDSSAKDKKRNIEGQVSLFEAMGEEKPRPPLPDVEELGWRDLLASEKEMTGIYISGHPMDSVREQVKSLPQNTRWIEEQRQLLGDAKLDGKSVRLGALVTHVRTKLTKTGNMMAFVQLEDYTGQIEALVFPRVYEEYRDILRSDSLILASGKLSLKEEEDVKLLLDKAALLSQRPLGSPAMKLYLNLPPARSHEVLPILKKYPGDCPVIFCENKKAFQPDTTLGVRYSEELNALLSEVIGETNVFFRENA